jgi:hypothetical protein
MNNQIIKSFICASAVTEFALVAIDSAGKVAIATDPTANTTLSSMVRRASLLTAQSPSPQPLFSLSQLTAKCRRLCPLTILLGSPSQTSIRPQPPLMSRS